MKILSTLSLALVVIGALNWGLVGLIDFNLVSFLFGVDSIFSNLIYILVGLGGLYSLSFFRFFVSDSPGHKGEREASEIRHSA